MRTLFGSLEVLSTTETPFFSLNSQIVHRRNILRSWLNTAQDHGHDLASNIVGKQTLDVGCGQGDMIELLAAALNAQGNKESKVIGVDPASLDYGTPWTLGEAQSSLSKGPLKEYLRFEQTTAPALVASQPKGTYTTAYFAQSLYYFPSSNVIVETFKSLLDAGVETLLLAEWSLSISQLAALPHLLAVLLQSMNPAAEGNVRTVLSPAAYVEAAKEAGWEVVGSQTFTPAVEVEDGKWEAKAARDIGKLAMQGKSERGVEGVRVESLRAHADALERSIDPEAGIDGVTCMDVWVAVFRPMQGGNMRGND